MSFCPLLPSFASWIAVLLYDLHSFISIGRHNRSQQHGEAGKAVLERSGEPGCESKRKAGAPLLMATPLFPNPVGTQDRPADIKAGSKQSFKGRKLCRQDSYSVRHPGSICRWGRSLRWFLTELFHLESGDNNTEPAQVISMCHYLICLIFGKEIGCFRIPQGWGHG